MMIALRTMDFRSLSIRADWITVVEYPKQYDRCGALVSTQDGHQYAVQESTDEVLAKLRGAAAEVVSN